MNKIVGYLKNIGLVIICLYTAYFIYNISSFTIEAVNSVPLNTLAFFIYAITVVMLAIFEIKKYRHKDPLINDLKYNIFYLLAEIMIIFIFIRNYLDPNLFITPNISFGEMNTVIYYGERSYFILNNLIYINILNVCLIAYYFVNKQIKDKK